MLRQVAFDVCCVCDLCCANSLVGFCSKATLQIVFALIFCYRHMQGQPPSVPYDRAQVQRAASALDGALREQLSLTYLRISKMEEPEDLSYQNHRTVPKALRAGWPREALQVMQSMDELQAQMLTKRQQHKVALQALEDDFMEMMTQLQERLHSLEF